MGRGRARQGRASPSRRGRELKTARDQDVSSRRPGRGPSPPRCVPRHLKSHNITIIDPSNVHPKIHLASCRQSHSVPYRHQTHTQRPVRPRVRDGEAGPAGRNQSSGAKSPEHAPPAKERPKKRKISCGRSVARRQPVPGVQNIRPSACALTGDPSPLRATTIDPAGRRLAARRLPE